MGKRLYTMFIKVLICLQYALLPLDAMKILDTGPLNLPNFKTFPCFERLPTHSLFFALVNALKLLSLSWSMCFFDFLIHDQFSEQCYNCSIVQSYKYRFKIMI